MLKDQKKEIFVKIVEAFHLPGALTRNPLQVFHLKRVIWYARKDSNLHRVAPTRT